MDIVELKVPTTQIEATEGAKHIVNSLSIGELEEAPFVPDLVISAVGGVVDRTMLVYGGLMYAPVNGETQVFGRTMAGRLALASEIPYEVRDIQEIGGRRKLLGISTGGGANIVLGTESQPAGDRYLVQTDHPRDFVRAALLGETSAPDGRKTQKVLLVTRYKGTFDHWNAISTADLKSPAAEVTAEDLKTGIHVTGLWPVQFENNQTAALAAYNRGDEGFIASVDAEGKFSPQAVPTDLYPVFVTQGRNDNILAITRTGVVRGNIKTETGEEPKIVFQKLKIPKELLGSICRVFPAGDDKLLLVGNNGTVSLVNPESGGLVAQLVHDELAKVPPGSLIHTYEALPTGPDKWTIFVNVRDRNGTVQEGKSFRVSVK